MYGYIFYWYLRNTSLLFFFFSFSPSFFEFELREWGVCHVGSLSAIDEQKKKCSCRNVHFSHTCCPRFLTSQSWSKWQRLRPCLRDVQTSVFFSKHDHESTEHCCKCIVLFHSCQVWITETVVCGACQRSSYWDYRESRTLLQELLLKQGGQITSLPFSASYTGSLLKLVWTTKSCLLRTAAWMARHSPPLPPKKKKKKHLRN